VRPRPPHAQRPSPPIAVVPPRPGVTPPIATLPPQGPTRRGL
jgi:hypothetical protein